MINGPPRGSFTKKLSAMNSYRNLKSFNFSRFSSNNAIAITIALLCSLLLTSCGGPDPEPTVKKFCSQVKIGESIMGVVTRAGIIDFDKYWLEKFDSEPTEGTKNIGIIRPRDLEKKTEKLKKLKNPADWEYGQFNAMIQELGYSRHVCSVDFSKDKVLKKKVFSVD